MKLYKFKLWQSTYTKTLQFIQKTYKLRGKTRRKQIVYLLFPYKLEDDLPF